MRLRQDMKRMLVCCLIVVTSILLCSCTTKTEEGTDISHVSVEAKTKYYENLPDMESDSDAILKVRKTDKEETVLKYHEDEFYSGYTFSAVVVEKIYADTSGTLQEGDEICLLENEVYDSGTKTVYHIANYNMLQKDHEYLLFLQRNIDKDNYYYVAAGVNFGTISLEEDGRNEAFKEMEPDYYSMFERLWAKAKEKYD